jgi:hypothetical protein
MAEPTNDSLIEAEHALQAAQLASDVNALELLLHDRLRFVGIDKGVHDKSEDLSALEAGLIAFKAAAEIEVEAHVFGTTGVSIALLELEVAMDGETTKGTYRYTRSWLYEDDRWQVIAGAVVAV